MAERGIEYITSTTKRRLDVLGAVALVGIVSPVVLGASIVAGVNSRTFKPFFKQPRIGHNGDEFNVIKLQTLRDEHMTDRLQTFCTFDPRATKVGLFMREVGIDELPQLINVLAGDMSLVGIRPLISPDINKMQSIDAVLFDEWYDAYTQSKPGATGPGQIYRHNYRYASDEVYRESMKVDMKYIESASLGRDLR